MADPAETQITIAARLQEKMLTRWEQLIDEGQMTPTDAATLARFLSANGWTVDPARVPKGLRGILTQTIDPTEFDQEEVQ